MPPASDTEQPAPRFWQRYFARRIVYPRELPSIMRKHIYTGVMGSVYFTLVTGIFFLYFGTAIGMSRFQWGLMGGVSSFLLSAQLLGALITRRLGHRKFLWLVCALAHRTLLLVGILLAFVIWQAGWPGAGAVLIVFVCVGNFLGAMASPPWLSWLADIIPEKDHGGFWGRRSAWIALSIVAVVIPAGLLFDMVPETAKLPLTVIVFGLATLVGVIDLFIHGTIPEPSMEVGVRNHFLQHLLTPLRDRSFRPWLAFNGCWTFGMTLGGSLAMLYFLEELGIKRNFLGGMIVLTSLPLVGGMLTGRWSGRLVDRLGSRRVLQVGHVCWSILPLLWIAAAPGWSALILLGCSSLIGGTSSTAAINAATKLITRTPPPSERAMYAAVSACLGSLAAGLGVLTAGAVLKHMGDWQTVIAGKTVVAFHLLFVGSFCIRLLSAVLLIPHVREPGG